MDHTVAIEAIREASRRAPWHMVQNVLIALALFGWLAWSRYLHYKETALLREGAAALPSLLEMRERWRIRWGMVAGIVILAAGVGLLVPMLVWGPSITSALRAQGPQDELTGIAMRASLVGVGSFAACAGAAVLAANIMWSRSRRSVCASPGREKSQEEA